MSKTAISPVKGVDERLAEGAARSALQWADQGPISQGRILTALLRGDQPAAVGMLAGWQNDDLRELHAAAVALWRTCEREAARRWPH